jgi:XisI protein
MDTQLKYRDIIKSVLQSHANYRAEFPDGYTSQALFDDERGQYLVLDIGWNGDRYREHLTFALSTNTQTTFWN